ncbi:MAG: acetate/propionate family kinase [Patescibacteria group bacterium]
MIIDHKTQYILVLNAGSATLKWALYTSSDLQECGRGAVERIGLANSFSENRIAGKLIVNKQKISSHNQALTQVLKLIAWHHIPLSRIIKVGHRVVHGGDKFIKPTKLSQKVIQQLSVYNNLAPLHNPIELETIKQSFKFLGTTEHWAVFDTAWFADLPDYAKYYALPLDLQKKKNIRRFGFHGISHQYVATKAAGLLNKNLAEVNLITCHLGSGSSVTAVKNGKVVDTSFGFTPLEGLMMTTRPGDVDPGLILYLFEELKLKPAVVKKMLNDESGLMGIAGVKDMREVLTRAGYEVLGYKSRKNYSVQEKINAKLALKMFIYRVQKYLGAYAAILGKVDAIVFTGGIGERNETIRTFIMKGLPTLKHIQEFVIPANEELAIAREIVKL